MHLDFKNTEVSMSPLKEGAEALHSMEKVEHTGEAMQVELRF